MPCNNYEGPVVTEYYPETDRVQEARQRGIRRAQTRLSPKETKRLRQRSATLAKLSRAEERKLRKLVHEIIKQTHEDARDPHLRKIISQYQEVK